MWSKALKVVALLLLASCYLPTRVVPHCYPVEVVYPDDDGGVGD